MSLINLLSRKSLTLLRKKNCKFMVSFDLSNQLSIENNNIVLEELTSDK